jgi:cell division cycle 14
MLTYAGIRHYDLQFPDCSVPTPDILDDFLDICDKEGVLAVHCLAGLGRYELCLAAWRFS